MMSPLPPSEKSQLVGDEVIETMPTPPPRTSKKGQENPRGSIEGIEMSDIDRSNNSTAFSSTTLDGDDKNKPSYKQLPTSPLDGDDGVA